MEKEVYDKLVDHIVQNQNKFYRITYCYVYEKEAALDIIQNAICKALENYTRLRNGNAIKTWFYRILINECLDYLKKQKKEMVCDPNEMLEDIYIEVAYDSDIELYQYVCQLPEQMKSIVIMHYFEQLTLKEIAQITEINLNTVKSRLYAALNRLKRELEVEL